MSVLDKAYERVSSMYSWCMIHAIAHTIARPSKSSYDRKILTILCATPLGQEVAIRNWFAMAESPYLGICVPRHKFVNIDIDNIRHRTSSLKTIFVEGVPLAAHSQMVGISRFLRHDARNGRNSGYPQY